MADKAHVFIGIEQEGAFSKSRLVWASSNGENLQYRDHGLVAGIEDGGDLRNRLHRATGDIGDDGGIGGIGMEGFRASGASASFFSGSEAGV